jgi:hypothetical protein
MAVRFAVLVAVLFVRGRERERGISLGRAYFEGTSQNEFGAALPAKPLRNCSTGHGRVVIL